MLIENAGFKGIYVDKNLASGYTPDEIENFVNQRKRWAAGCIQTEKNYHILNKKGLNFMQKCDYIFCINYWLFPIKIFFYLIAPILYTVFNVVIINSSAPVFLLMWLPQYILKSFFVDKVYNSYKSTTWNKIYEVILFPKLIFTCIKELFGIKQKKFYVTKKEEQSNKVGKTQLQMIGAHAAFFIINFVAYYISSLKGFILPAVFSIINLVYLTFAITFDSGITKKDSRAKPNNKKYTSIFKEK